MKEWQVSWESAERVGLPTPSRAISEKGEGERLMVMEIIYGGEIGGRLSNKDSRP